MNYDDLKWTAKNSGGDSDDNRSQGEIHTGTIRFTGYPFELCESLVDLHNTSLDTLRAREAAK